MKILKFDLSSTNDAEAREIYCCNNSLLHLREDLFLMTYRRIEYVIPNARYRPIHPWKMWDNGYKFLHEDPHRPDNENTGLRKWRDAPSSDRFLRLPENADEDDRVPDGYREFDSTGLVLLRKKQNEDAFLIVRHVNNIFGQDMNQDCRIYKEEGGGLCMCYNVFLRPDRCVMMRRRFLLRMEETGPDFLYMLPEQEIIPTPICRRIEKNCLMDKNLIFYTFEKGVFTVLENRDGITITHRHEVPFLRRLCQYYRGHIHISLGTPPLPVWAGRSVAVGHIKIEFRHRLDHLHDDQDNDPLTRFMRTVCWDNIYRHGRYLYFLFFFEFNNQFRITRLSHCLLPTDKEHSHLPYLIVFPCGLTTDNGGYRFWLSYGEGDVRCKVLMLDRDELDDLLLEACSLTVETYQMRLLDVDAEAQRPRMYHIGYFYEKNCGDDMFRMVFRDLQARCYPDVRCIMRNHYKQQEIGFVEGRDLLVFGGGDIVNSYFLASLASDPRRKIAVGIGIPYIDNLGMLAPFSSVFLRSAVDLPRVSASRDNVLQFPDLGFWLPRMISRETLDLLHQQLPIQNTTRPRLGISMCRTFYKRGREQAYMKLILALCETIRMMVATMDVYLIPFCTNPRKHPEDDRVVMSHIKEFFREDPRVIDTSDWPLWHDEVIQTYAIIANMDFMVCSRFHSHIFAMCHNIPMISFSQNRKTINLMRETGLEDLVFPFLAMDGIPHGIDARDLVAFLMTRVETREAIRERLVILSGIHEARMDQFEIAWKGLIREMIPDKTIPTRVIIQNHDGIDNNHHYYDTGMTGAYAP